MNRIANAIAAQKVNIDTRLDDGRTTHEAMTALDTQLDMCLEEYVRFQELKSLADADGTITAEEGQLVYAYLGDTPQRFNRQPLEVKVTLTNMFTELLTASLMGRV